MNLLITVLSLGLLVFIHELGHYLVARFFKVKIETFSIGFGPRLFSFNRAGTEYVVALIPLGGYVKMKGDVEPDPSDTAKTAINGSAIEHPTNEQIIDAADSFYAKKWWQRALIVFAGPVFNFFLAIVLISMSFLIGRTYSDLYPIIESVNAPFSEYFMPGDRIISVNSEEVRSFTEIFTKMNESEMNSFLLVREDVEMAVSLHVDSRVDLLREIRPVTSNIVGEVSPGLPAWKAGIRAGDRIVSIDGNAIHNWYDVRTGIAESADESIILKIQRDDRLYEISLVPEINPLSESNNKIIGIVQRLDLSFHERYGLFGSIGRGITTSISFVYLNYKSLYQLVQSPAAFRSSIGGPIMVYYMTSQTSQRGISD